MPGAKHPDYQFFNQNSLLDQSIIWNDIPHYGKLPIINA